MLDNKGLNALLARATLASGTLMLRPLCALAVLALTLFAQPAMAAFDNTVLQSSGPLTIERITPDGDDVKVSSRQIVISFNRPVVATGKMDRSSAEIPVTITPAVECQWRWISTRALACNLDEKQKLLLATEYHLTMKPGIKTLDNVTLEAPYEHHFITQRPQMRGVSYKMWKSPVLPVFRAYWDQQVTKSSVLKHVYFETGDKRRIPAVISADTNKRKLPSWLWLPGEKSAVETNQQEDRSDDDLTMVNNEEARRVWSIEPATDLPSSEKVVYR